MASIGVRFDENMSGTYRRLGRDEGDRPFRFHVDAVSPSLARTLRTGEVGVTGWVEADGIATRAPLTGTMVMRPLLSRFVRYEFSFVGDDGTRYRYAGQKNIRHLDPVRTWTTLPGSIYDADRNEIATSVARFDLREMLPFLLSYRLTLPSATRATRPAPTPRG